MAIATRIITEFDNVLWYTVIERVLVRRDGILVFCFQTGEKIEGYFSLTTTFEVYPKSHLITIFSLQHGYSLAGAEKYTIHRMVYFFALKGNRPQH